MQGSMLDIAYDFLSSKSKAVTFKQIWAQVVKQKGLSEDEASNKVSGFYTFLLLDGRFVTLGENKWDLRSRHTFDKVHIDMKDVYGELDSDDTDTEEASEEKEYNKDFEEPSESDRERVDFGQDEEPDEELSKEEEALNS